MGDRFLGKVPGVKSSRRKRTGWLRWRLTMTRWSRSWVTWRMRMLTFLPTLQNRLAILNQSIAAQEHSLEIAETRYNAGETSELDPLQARTELSKTKAEAPELESGIVQAKNALAVLLWTTPAEIEHYVSGPGRIPVAPVRIAAGIPRDLLRAAGLTCAWQVSKPRRSHRRSGLRSPICCHRSRSRVPLVRRE